MLVYQVLPPTEKSRGPYDVCTGNGWHHKEGPPSLQNVNLGNGRYACLPLATEVDITFCLTMSLPAFCSKEDTMSFRTLSTLTLCSSRRHYFHHSETPHLKLLKKIVSKKDNLQDIQKFMTAMDNYFPVTSTPHFYTISVYGKSSCY